jgi:hypothetical protein
LENLKSLLEAFSNNSRDGEGIAYAARRLFEQRICSSPAGKLDSKTLAVVANIETSTELIKKFSCQFFV